jgi:DNA-binding CsgD family transcriptional regulator
MADLRAVRTLGLGSGKSLPLWTLYCSNCLCSVRRKAGGQLPHLTDRQRQCLEGFLARKTAKQIGRELGITHHAVEQHLKAARKKFGTADTLEAARLYAASAYTTDGPYYAAPEVSDSAAAAQCSEQPRPGIFQLRDIATEEPGIIQGLSAKATLAAIGLSGIVMITILTLIVAVANGVAQLAP